VRQRLRVWGAGVAFAARRVVVQTFTAPCARPCSVQAAARASEQRAASLEAALAKSEQLALSLTDKVAVAAAEAINKVEGTKVKSSVQGSAEGRSVMTF